MMGRVLRLWKSLWYGNPITPLLFLMAGAAATITLSEWGVIPVRPEAALAIYYVIITAGLYAEGLRRLAVGFRNGAEVADD